MAGDELTKITVRREVRAPVARQRFRLTLEGGAVPATELVSSEDRVIVGRSPQADLVVDDDFVSRIHCEIVAEPDGFILRDLGSKNGTRTAGMLIREICLPSEARISIGRRELSFSLFGAVEELNLYPDNRFGRLLGETSQMRAAFARLARVAARDITLLIEGESGTGKELAAEAVHEASARKGKPFVVVDCGSIPRTLLEAELFGHERGAYTGASHSRLGAFVNADGGTIFLDEVGELDSELQPRLLGVLERREVKPIGAAQPIPVNVRVIAATNRDLRREANRGVFREDLYYRLAVATVRLPPLREHVSDVPLLVRHFLELHSRKDGVEYQLADEVLQRLMQRAWPGNVRELRNAVEQVVAFGIEEVALVETPERTSAPLELPFKLAKAQLVEKFEREYLTAVLAQFMGNITAAASAAEIDRVHFLRLLDRYGLRKSRREPTSSRPGQ
jgi:two-component system, NtrC family, response regulator GlrR